MSQALTRCAVLGGIVVFLWGVFSWMVLPWHQMTMHKFSNEKRVAEVIQDHADMSGAYVIPNCMHHDKNMSKEDMRDEMMKGKEMMRTGPIVFAMVQKNGMKMGMAAAFILTLIVQIIAAYLITWLLFMTKATNYMKQVRFVTIIALIAAIIVYIPDWIWMGASCGFVVVHMLDLIIGWFLGGLVIAKFAKR